MSESLVHHRELVDADEQICAVHFAAFGEIKGMIKRLTEAGAIEVSCQRIEIGEVFTASCARQVGIHESQNTDLPYCFSALVEFGACAVMDP